MNKGFKGIVITLALVLALTLAVGLSACNETEYYSVSTECNVDQSIAQITVSPSTNTQGYQKGEAAYVTVAIAPGSKYEVESVSANGTALSCGQDGKYNFTVEGNTKISVQIIQTTDVALTVSADDEKGSFVVSPVGTVFAPNTTVQITATAKEGYILKSYTVNGTETHASADGSLSLTLKVDTQIVVNFVAHMEENVFATLQGRLKVKGSYFYDADDDDYDFTHNIETVFGDKQISQIESDAETGKVYFESVFGKNNRNITVIQHTNKNTVVELTSDELFETYYNPFDLLAASDFEKVSDTEYVMYNAAKAKEAASALSGWTESIASFTITVENGVATKLHIVTERIQPSSASETYVSTYDLDLSEHGTASVDTLYTQPYPHTADHDVLASALQAASEKAAYTVRHQGHEVGYKEPEGGETRPGYGDTDYKVYVNEQMVYDSYKNEEHGYVALDGYVYPFDYLKSSNQVVLRDPVDVESIAYYQPSLLGFDVALFKKVDENKYTLHQDSMAQTVAPYFAIGNEQAYYKYAQDLTLILADGALKQVVFTYKTYGIEETVTLTFDFNTAFDVKTDLGLDFENASKTSVLDDYIGQYKDNEGNFLTVDKSGFTLNGSKIALTEYHQSTDITAEYFVGTWENKSVTISKLSKEQISVATDDLSIIYILDKVDTTTVKIPDEYHGVWKYKDSNYDDTFVFQTYTIKYNGALMTVISYSESEGIIAKLDSYTYNFEVQQVKNGNETVTALYVLIIDNRSGTALDQFHAFKTTDSAGIEIPADYVGLYMSSDETFKVRITYSDITINGQPFTPTSYSSETGFVGTYGTDTAFVVSFYSVFGKVNKDKLYISANGGQVLERTTAFNTKYIGTWATDKDSTYDYTIVITDTSITVNGKPYPVQFDENYGYVVNFEGDPYTKYILVGYNIYGNFFMTLYDDNDLMVVLFKKISTKVPEEIIGTWEGADGATKITAVIDKNGKLQLKIGDAAFVSIRAEYDVEEGQFEFDLNGTKTFFTYDAEAKKFNLYQVDGGYDVDFTLGANINAPKNLQHTWTSEDGTSITINEHNIIFSLEGGEPITITKATITDYSSNQHLSYYVEFYVGERCYTFEYGTYGDNATLSFDKDGKTVFKMLVFVTTTK